MVSELGKHLPHLALREVLSLVAELQRVAENCSAGGLGDSAAVRLFVAHLSSIRDLGAVFGAVAGLLSAAAEGGIHSSGSSSLLDCSVRSAVGSLGAPAVRVDLAAKTVLDEAGADGADVVALSGLELLQAAYADLVRWLEVCVALHRRLPPFVAASKLFVVAELAALQSCADTNVQAK